MGFFCCCCFCTAKDGTWGLERARQMLYAAVICFYCNKAYHRKHKRTSLRQAKEHTAQKKGKGTARQPEAP